MSEKKPILNAFYDKLKEDAGKVAKEFHEAMAAMPDTRKANKGGPVRTRGGMPVKRGGHP